MNRFLTILKKRGAQTTQQVGKPLEMTSEVARLHLKNSQKIELVAFEKESVGVGRPALKWKLSTKGHKTFPGFLPRFVYSMVVWYFVGMGAGSITIYYQAFVKRNYKKIFQSDFCNGFS